jgi:hypothetical protein
MKILLTNFCIFCPTIQGSNTHNVSHSYDHVALKLIFLFSLVTSFFIFILLCQTISNIKRWGFLSTLFLTLIKLI